MEGRRRQEEREVSWPVRQRTCSPCHPCWLQLPWLAPNLLQSIVTQLLKQEGKGLQKAGRSCRWQQHIWSAGGSRWWIREPQLGTRGVAYELSGGLGQPLVTLWHMASPCLTLHVLMCLNLGDWKGPGSPCLPLPPYELVSTGKFQSFTTILERKSTKPMS